MEKRKNCPGCMGKGFYLRSDAKPGSVGNAWVETCEVCHGTGEFKRADLVAVVRCKDCKHMEVTPDCLRWCHVWNGINGMGDDGFCSYGERRTNATN